VLSAVFGGAFGADTVSRVKGDWNACSLAGEPIVRLIWTAS
jgi:hypothetical protein